MVGIIQRAGCVLVLSATSAWAAHHSGDSNWDGAVCLSELLRVVQFYNSEGYHWAAETTEDSYAPGPGDTAAVPHDSDYAPQNWAIELTELMRFVQFFNSGGYHTAEDSEDGFAPGRTGDPYLLPVEGDRDGDLLTDEEEGFLHTNPDLNDEDEDGVIDGVGLAKRLATQIAALPKARHTEEPRVNYVFGTMSCSAPFSHDLITLTDGYLYNELMLDSAVGFVDLPYGALHFLENGSFSYPTVNDACEWSFREISRIPAHVLYYLMQNVPGNLPGTHLVALDGDADGDYLTDVEENAIGYAPDDPDEDGNGTPDGLDLARAMADKIMHLPVCWGYVREAAADRSVFHCKRAWTAGLRQPAFKTEKVISRCVDVLEMDCEAYDPVLGLSSSTEYAVYTDTGSYYLSGLVLTIMQLEGTFSFYECLFGCESIRLDVPFLYELINMAGVIQAPPDSHLVPLDYDDDGDFLSNNEELDIGYNPNEPDEDENGTLDGIDLAHAFAAKVRALPECAFEKVPAKAVYSCAPESRAALLTISEDNAPEPLSRDGIQECKRTSSANCLLYDPVLSVSLAAEEYTIYSGMGDQYYVEFGADALMLYIMETEGSMSFWFESNGEWVLRRLYVYRWYHNLMR